MIDNTIYASMVLDPANPVHCTYTDEDGTIVIMVEEEAAELLPPLMDETVRVVHAPRFRTPLPVMTQPEDYEPPMQAAYIPVERIRPVPGGVSCGHYKITAGTTGLWVKDKQTGGTGLISNNHVLANVDSGNPGDDILQPGQVDGGSRPGDTIADLTRFVPMLTGGLKKVDCAIAAAKSPDVVDLRINELGYCYGIGTVYSGQMIWKSGRTTGLSAGKITSTNVTVQVYYSNTEYVTYTDCFTTGLYSGPGDSGSAILDFGSDLLLGLLFAGNGVQTIGCKAVNIAAELGIEIIPPPEIRSSQFVDVSHWQGAIDWAKMKARGVRGVVCKVSQGAALVDDRFAEYYAGAKAAGLLVGGYIFVDPAEASAQAHYLNFISALGDRDLDLPPVLDCEKAGTSQQVITACIQNLSEMLADHFGTLPMIYTNASFWNTNVLAWSGWKVHPLWVAYWKAASALSPLLPDAWKGTPGQPVMWQYTVTDAAAYFGVSSTQLDLDKTYPSFEALLDPQPPPPPPDYVTLTVNIDGQGSVTPGSGQYPKDSQVSLQATPAEGWQFEEWVFSDSESEDNPLVLTLHQDTGVWAMFGELGGGIAEYTHNKGRVMVDGLRIRTAPGVGATITGRLNTGNIIEILETRKDSSGNTWARLGWQQWACMVYGSRIYIRYILEGEA